MPQIIGRRRIRVPRCGLAARWRLGVASRPTRSEISSLPQVFVESPAKGNVPRTHQEIDRLVKEGAMSLDSCEGGWFD